ncbi:peroxiredoxin-like protein [Scopulibacillus daqui]|uniref:Peroxiredoxin-like protein n=1 Tax=Scopulibacillus daqui TaxID=1469162 RepID=A0ABS2PV49_9BACL|nr:OsmC family protein [Scopulibacillus daqui]MBM7643922.1 peroxiredoxin-like protein [Scopulibacillus daqui]
MSEFTFSFNGEWKGGRSGYGHICTKGLDQTVSIGAEMNGPGQGTNPDELLISAVATCYMMTLGIALDKRRLPYEKIVITSKGTVTDDSGLHFKEIIHFPTAIIKKDTDKDIKEKILQAMAQAEKDCMIAKALKGNVEISVKPQLKARED